MAFYNADEILDVKTKLFGVAEQFRDGGNSDGMPHLINRKQPDEKRRLDAQDISHCISSSMVRNVSFLRLQQPTYVVFRLSAHLTPMQGRRKQIESGGLLRRKNFFGPPLSFGPLHFNSMKLKWGGHKRKVEAPKTAHLQISNKAWYLWQCFLLLPF